MKKIIFLVFLVSLSTISISAQNNNSKVVIGDTFVICEIENDQYKYISFPKSNMIIKKGGIVNYNILKGKKVEVTFIEEKKNGTTIATIKLLSGKMFFNSHKYITVNIDEAISYKELLQK